MDEQRADRTDNTDQTSDQPTELGAGLTRRTALQGGLTLGVGVAGASLLAACSSGKKSFSGSGDKSGKAANGNKQSNAAPRGGGAGIVPTPREQTVIVDQMNMTVFDRFNPVIPNGESYQGGVGEVVKEYLWYFNLATGEMKPWLAKSWTYANNYQQMTIALNPKARWNDGQPFTSKDIKFTLELLKNNKTLLGGGTVTNEIKSITTPNPQTIVINLNTVDPRYHYNFVCGIVGGFLVLPEHIWSKQDPSKFANNPPVYTGPYKLKQVIADHQMFVWEKNPKYWNIAEFNPAPRYVAYRNAPPPDSALQQFKDGQSDVTANTGMYALIDAAIQGGYQNAIITKMTDPCPNAMFVNCDPSRGLLADPRMRQALSALVDRKKIGTSIWPINVDPAPYPWPNYPNNKKWEVSSLAAKYPLSYDQKKAESILDSLGAKKGSDGKRSYQGKPLSYQVITPVTTADPEYFIAQLMATNLKKVGIDANAKAVAGSVYNVQVQKGDYDIRSEWLCGELLDPWQVYNAFSGKFWEPVGTPATAGNSVRLKSKSYDNAVDKLGRLSPTSAQAKPLFADALNEWYESMPVVLETQKIFGHAFNTTYWDGWPTDDNLYQVPNNWWGQFMFVIGSLKPAGTK
jgi:peptide/nickel transport system substrate-binding protein